jgi:hypothetical protein
VGLGSVQLPCALLFHPPGYLQTSFPASHCPASKTRWIYLLSIIQSFIHSFPPCFQTPLPFCNPSQISLHQKGNKTSPEPNALPHKHGEGFHCLASSCSFLPEMNWNHIILLRNTFLGIKGLFYSLFAMYKTRQQPFFSFFPPGRGTSGCETSCLGFEGIVRWHCVILVEVIVRGGFSAEKDFCLFMFESELKFLLSMNTVS